MTRRDLLKLVPGAGLLAACPGLPIKPNGDNDYRHPAKRPEGMTIRDYNGKIIGVYKKGGWPGAQEDPLGLSMDGDKIAQ